MVLTSASQCYGTATISHNLTNGGEGSLLVCASDASAILLRFIPFDCCKHHNLHALELTPCNALPCYFAPPTDPMAPNALQAYMNAHTLPMRLVAIYQCCAVLISDTTSLRSRSLLPATEMN